MSTASRESGRARLRQYVTTDTVTQEVPVSHEEIGEEEHEVMLHGEVPVVDKDAVADERGCRCRRSSG